MGVPKKRTSRQKRDQRRASNFKAVAPNVTACTNCGEPVLSHRACPKCGLSIPELEPRRKRDDEVQLYAFDMVAYLFRQALEVDPTLSASKTATRPAVARAPAREPPSATPATTARSTQMARRLR